MSTPLNLTIALDGRPLARATVRKVGSGPVRITARRVLLYLPCPECDETGYVLAAAPDRYDAAMQAWYPAEVQVPCPHCGGAGKVENLEWLDLPLATVEELDEPQPPLPPPF